MTRTSGSGFWISSWISYADETLHNQTYPIWLFRIFCFLGRFPQYFQPALGEPHPWKERGQQSVEMGMACLQLDTYGARNPFFFKISAVWTTS